MATKDELQTIQKNVLDALSALSDTPGATFQLMNLSMAKGGKEYSQVGYFNDWQELAAEAARLTTLKLSKAVYVTLQEIDPECINRAENKMLDSAKAVSAADVVRYRLFLIDLDRKGIKDISATEDEKTSIRQALDEMTDFLIHELDWPDPRFKGDSGNGYHAAWGIDLPPTKENQELLKRCYQALQQKFGSDLISIDSSLADPNQLIKLYGTKARKGDDTDKRPHRFSKLLDVYETESVTGAQLQALAALYIPERKGQQQTTRRAVSWHAQTPENVEAWAEHHGLKLGDREKFADSNGEGYKWKVDCLTSDEHKDGAALLLNAKGYLNYKCHHNSCSEKSIAEILTKYPPKVHVNGHSSQKAKHPVNTGSDDLAQPDLLLSVDEVLQAIGDIGATQYTDLDTDPEKAKKKAAALRKARIVKELGFAIGELERTDHALVTDTLVTAGAGFTQTAAKDFIGGCVADAKKRHKEAARQRAEQARQNLLVVRAQKGKLSIDVGNRQLSDIFDEALQVLVDSNAGAPTMFVRGGALVRIVQDERGHYGIQEFSGGAMLGKLAAVADWETISLDSEGNPKTTAVFPPRDVVSTILSAGEWPEMPALAGVVTSPVFSRDGVLHDQPGYDKATRLYYTGGVKLGDTTPTPENIERAKDLILNNLLLDFPFKDPASLAHAIAYMLLPYTRDMIDGPTPVHDVDSPTAGTGKGKLLNACAYPFLGHDVPTMAAAKDDDEWRKRITTSLMNGSTHLVIDNVNHELDSGSLASAFTQPLWEDRTLGANREVKIPIRTIWGITANNIKMSQELARRCVWIRLDANVEKPWERTEFKHKNLIGWARGNRDALVTAALTFVRAWVDKGMPLYTKRTKGSYEAWAGVMGGILEVVGIPGFLDNETELYERVVSKNDLLIDFVKAWWERQQALEGKRQAEIIAGGESKTETCLSSFELFKLASYADDEAQQKMGEWHNLLGDMLTSPKQKGRQTQLGKILDTHHDKVVAGFKISLAKTANGSKFWMLHPASVEPQKQVLPGSTVPLPPVERVSDDALVEPVELNHPYNAYENIFFTRLENGQEKNNISHIATGVNGSTGSTNNGKNGASTSGRGLVEPRFEVLPETEVLPEIEVVTWEL